MREESKPAWPHAFEDQAALEFSQTSDTLGRQAHFVAEARKATQKTKKRITTFSAKVLEVVQHVPQNQERWVGGGLDMAHPAPLDVEPVTVKHSNGINLNDDRSAHGFHLFQDASGVGIVPSGLGLEAVGSIELAGNDFGVERVLFGDPIHLRRRR
jgi:hypothetical protein